MQRKPPRLGCHHRQPLWNATQKKGDECVGNWQTTGAHRKAKEIGVSRKILEIPVETKNEKQRSEEISCASSSLWKSVKRDSISSVWAEFSMIQPETRDRLESLGHIAAESISDSGRWTFLLKYLIWSWRGLRWIFFLQHTVLLLFCHFNNLSLPFVKRHETAWRSGRFSCCQMACRPLKSGSQIYWGKIFQQAAFPFLYTRES